MYSLLKGKGARQGDSVSQPIGPYTAGHAAAMVQHHDANTREQHDRPRPDRAGGTSAQSGAPLPARYDAPGDEPLMIAATLALDQPFRFDRGLAKRLRM